MHSCLESIGLIGLSFPINQRGLSDTRAEVCLDWLDLLQEKVLTGTSQVPCNTGVGILREVEALIVGKLPVDKLITQTLLMGRINEAMESCEKRDPERNVILF